MKSTNHILDTALEISDRAAELIRLSSQKIKSFKSKGEVSNLVTQTDIEADKLITKKIKESFPEHNIVSEELGSNNLSSDYTWYIDPIDGTNNFVHNYPSFAVSIGVFFKSKPLVGVVYDIPNNEKFFASKGGGSFSNDSPISVSDKDHFNEGLALFNDYDSILSCTVSKRFIWREDGIAINYDINNRPRRQDYKGDLIENGAFYISTVRSVKATKNRISGNIGVYIMPEYSSIEIDEPIDWLIAESLMKKCVINFQEYDFSKIKIFLSDVDGVLTDAGMYYTENGDEFKKFCTYDGMGFQLLQKTGVKVGILTSEDKDLNRRRAEKLGLDFDFHGAKDKLQIVIDLCKKENITLEEVAYIGDDINCFELLSNVGIAACPNNAVAKIKSITGIIELNKNGGEGVVREFIDSFL